MVQQILEFLASEIGRNLLASVAATLTIVASAYAFFRWLKRRYDSLDGDDSSPNRHETPRHKMRSFRAELNHLRKQGRINPESVGALVEEYRFDDQEYKRAMQALNMGELHALRAFIKSKSQPAN
jgi:hypothetical protein